MCRAFEQLRRGGRIGAAASLWGTMLAIKPILAVEDGKVVPLEKVRSAAKAIARLKEIVVADAAARPEGQARLAVHHFGNPAEAEQLAAQLADAVPGCAPVQISALPAVLAAHAGLGVAGGNRGGGQRPADPQNPVTRGISRSRARTPLTGWLLPFRLSVADRSETRVFVRVRALPGVLR